MEKCNYWDMLDVDLSGIGECIVQHSVTPCFPQSPACCLLTVSPLLSVKMSLTLAQHICRVARLTCGTSGQQGLASRVQSVAFDVNQPGQLDVQLLQQPVSVPVLVTGAMKQWEAIKWSKDDLKRLYGDIPVPVEVSYHGGDYRDLHEPRGTGSKGFEADMSVPLSLLLDSMRVDTAEQQPADVALYAAQTDLLEIIPELEAGVQAPPLALMLERLYKRNTWLGPSGTRTPLHCDPYFNLFCQVWGSKYIRLYDHKYMQQLYPFGNHFLRNTSQVDVENVDRKRFPNFAQTPYLECYLEAGDMLFIPKRFWHYVRALSPSWSVSYWWT